MAIRERTIQHPGFEFYETKETVDAPYIQNSSALSLGYFPKGPVAEPITLTSIEQLETIFGTPENDAEYYSYMGAQAILSNARPITVIRIPYDNSLTTLQETDSEIKTHFIKRFKVLKGKIEVAPDSTGKYQDIQNAYEKDVTFKTITWTPDLYEHSKTVLLNSDYVFESGSAMDPYDGNDFVILNKYNDAVYNNEEYIVNVYGTGNAVRKQGLAANASIKDEINYFKVDANGISEIFKPTDSKITYAKDKTLWQYSGNINKDGLELTVADEYFTNLVSNVPKINLLDTDELFKYQPASPAIKYQFFTDNDKTFEILEKLSTSELKIGDKFSIKDIVNNVDTISVYKDGSDKKFDGEFTKELSNAVIEVVHITEDSYSEDQESKLTFYADCKYRLNILNQKGTVVKSYVLKFSTAIANSTIEDELNGSQKAIWDVELEAGFERSYETNPTFINFEKSHNITVVVSKIVNSTLETGKFIIEPVEVFSGSIYKNDRNPLTGESLYIGTQINSYSNIIKFYARGEYENYDKQKDNFLIEQTTPYRFDVIQDGQIRVDSDEKFNLNKIILQSTANKTIETFKLENVVEELLNLVRNNIAYTYTDVYDFGVSSILTYAALNPVDKNYYYTPAAIGANYQSITDLKLYKWKQVIRKFISHCQYKHKLSMFHADAPRALLLNGNLSRIDDLKHEQSVILDAKHIHAMSIKDSTYASINTQWWEIMNRFTNNKCWIPTSISLASNITYNDIINNVWDAPAGYRYGRVIGQFYRPAFNPSDETKDRLYSNCLNYGIAWPDGTLTIEGQKTCCYEQTVLNRINTRRLMINIERFVQDVSNKYTYMPNTDTVRGNYAYEISTELQRMKNSGGLYEYRVVCDATNNTADVIDRNELRIAIMVQPVQTLEFIVAKFVVAKSTTILDEISIY